MGSAVGRNALGSVYHESVVIMRMASTLLCWSFIDVEWITKRMPSAAQVPWKVHTDADAAAGFPAEFKAVSGLTELFRTKSLELNLITNFLIACLTFFFFVQDNSHMVGTVTAQGSVGLSPGCAISKINPKSAVSLNYTILFSGGHLGFCLDAAKHQTGSWLVYFSGYLYF